MMKIFFCHILIIATTAWANTPDPCRDALAAHYVRGSAPSHVSELSESVKNIPFSGNQIIDYLQASHISAYKEGRVSSEKFDPSWILKDAEVLDFLLSNFPDSFSIQSNETSSHSYQGIDTFFDFWRDSYVKARGGDAAIWVAKSWSQKRTGVRSNSIDSGRTKMLKTLVFELAYLHQDRIDGIALDQPLQWDKVFDMPFLSDSGAILDLFGSKDQFQKDYDIWARRRSGQRVPYSSSRRSAVVIQAERELKAMSKGQTAKSKAFIPAPGIRVKDDERARKAESFVNAALQTIRLSESTNTQLASIFPLTQEGSRIFLDLKPLDEIVKIFGSVELFVRKLIEADVNGTLEITKGPDVLNFAQELFVQAGHAYVKAGGRLSTLRFSGLRYRMSFQKFESVVKTRLQN